MDGFSWSNFQGAEMTDRSMGRTVALYRSNRSVDGWIVMVHELPSRERSHIPPKWHFEDDFPNFPRWDMLIPWRVPIFSRRPNSTHNFPKVIVQLCSLMTLPTKATSAYAEASIASGFVRVDDAEVPGGLFSATNNGQNPAVHISPKTEDAFP